MSLSAKEVIRKTKSILTQINSQKENQQHSQTNNELNAFDLVPIEFTGKIQDYLFKESDQIYNILKQQTDQDIEGLTYNQIKLDQTKNTYLQKVIANIPQYYNLKPSDRQKHFQIQGKLFIEKMNINSNLQIQSHSQPRKIKISQRDLTPMKNVKISKKQVLRNKKISKKNTQINKEKLEVGQKKQMKQNDENVFLTPQKCRKQKKSVKFSQFQYVKDFSQYKTPKNLQTLQQYMQPLKEIQPTKKQQ